MTSTEPTSSRLGLSFTQEASLLAGLRLSGATAPPGLPVALRTRWPASPRERRSLEEALRRDLIDEPAATERHPEWVDRQRSGWPAPLRAVSTRADTRSTPLSRAAWPVLSARHRREATAELGRLALLAPDRRVTVERHAARRALGILARALGRREGLAVLLALGEGADSDLVGSEGGQPTATPRPAPLIQTLRAAFARAAERAEAAAAPGELLDHFGLFVLGFALAGPFRVEARALAEVRPLREGGRLLRHRRRASRAPAVLCQALRELVTDALSELVP